MSDDLQQIAQVSAQGGAIGGVAGFARLLIFGQDGGWFQWLSSTVAGATVGVMLWLILQDTRAWDYSPPTSVKVAAVIAASMIARDLLLGLRALGVEFGRNPIGLVQSLWNAIRGK